MQPVCGAEVGPLGAWEALGRCGVWNGMDLRAGCGPSLGGAAKASNYATCVPTIHLEIKGQLPVLRHSCPHSHPQPLPGTGPRPGSPLPPRHQGCLSSCCILSRGPWTGISLRASVVASVPCSPLTGPCRVPGLQLCAFSSEQRPGSPHWGPTSLSSLRCLSSGVLVEEMPPRTHWASAPSVLLPSLQQAGCPLPGLS